MILTCPNCNSHFKLDVERLGNNGRKVRCSSCDDVWFQEPEDEDVEAVESVDEEASSELEEIDVLDEDVPFASPDEQEDEIIAKVSPDLNPNKGDAPKSKALGYGAAAAVFVVILVYLLASSASIMKSNPAAQAFYALLGIHMDVAGQGLVFDKVRVSDNGEVINVSGDIVNLETDERDVPLIEASLMDVDNAVLTQWYIEAPKNKLAAEESLSFDSMYYKDDNSDHGEVNLQVRFVLSANISAQTDEEGGESNPALPQGESDHQSDHEVSSKSHQPASSEHHPAPSH